MAIFRPMSAGTHRHRALGSGTRAHVARAPEYWVQMGRAGSFVPEIRRSIVAGEAAAEVASIELILNARPGRRSRLRDLS